MRKSQWRKPYRVKRRIPIFKNRIFRQAVLTLLLLIGFFYLICFSSIFQIKKVIITGEEKISAQDIKDVIEKEIEKKILIFSSKSIFLLKPGKIKQVVLNDFPQIVEIEIKRGLPDALDIVVIERAGAAIWCQEQDCFLIDEQGIIFEKMYEVGSCTFLKIMSLERIENIELGEKVIDKNLLSEILDIELRLKKESDIDLNEILIISDKRLNAKTFDAWEIYFNLEKNIDWQITELSLVLEQEIPKEQRKNLEYIDLRFSKVYYKYKD